MKKVLIAPLLAAAAVATECSFSTSYVTAANSLLKCMEVSLSLDVGDFSVDLDLGDCLSKGDISVCQETLRAFADSHPDSLFADVANKLAASPSEYCPCISESADTLSSCFSSVSQLSTYCSMATIGSGADVNPIQFETDSCTQAIQETCNLVDPTFMQTYSCLQQHAEELKSSCHIALNSMLATLYETCEAEILSICLVGEHPVTTTCLLDNYDALSDECAQELDTLLALDFPCASEAAALCPSQQSVHGVLTCLSSHLSEHADEFSNACAAMTKGYANCIDNPPEDGPGGKPKPGPARRGLKQKRSDQTEAPPAKTKPQPRRPCWAGPGDDGDITDPGSEPGSSTGGDLSHEGSSESSKSSGSGKSLGTVVSVSVLSVFVIVGVAAASWYKVSNGDANNSDTRGYWRAPVIHASWGDDSSHHTKNKLHTATAVAVVSNPASYVEDEAQL
jgi:hypothetical protein